MCHHIYLIQADEWEGSDSARQNTATGSAPTQYTCIWKYSYNRAMYKVSHDPPWLIHVNT